MNTCTCYPWDGNHAIGCPAGSREDGIPAGVTRRPFTEEETRVLDRSATLDDNILTILARVQELEAEVAKQHAINLSLVNARTIAWEIEHDRALEAEREVTELKAELLAARAETTQLAAEAKP